MAPKTSPPTNLSPPKTTTPRNALHHRPTTSDPSRLAPEDAFYATSPPRRERRNSPLGLGAGANGNGARSLLGDGGRRKGEKERGRSGSRRRKGAWKKLLWVKQSYPDNYTDEETFLDHLQRNPRLQPYEFWSLVADLTVIVQHICSVTIFLCCFTAIFYKQISPVSVVGWGTLATVLGWAVWDSWVSREEAEAAAAHAVDAVDFEPAGDGDSNSSSSPTAPVAGVGIGHVPDAAPAQGLGLHIPSSSANSNGGANASDAAPARTTSYGASSLLQPPPSATAAAFVPPLTPTGHPTGAPTFATYTEYPPYEGGASPRSSSASATASAAAAAAASAEAARAAGALLSPRNQQRLATLKSAVLIFCAMLGLSPILKSLTEAWASDSIWAMSCGLVCINVFFFDYGGGQAKLPASFSMNAAVMASTVLASRLPYPTHVFSLSLFSIEVFALFPIFRRSLRHVSPPAHLALTVLLVTGAGGAVGLTVARRPGWTAAIAGVVLGDCFATLAMGVTSWWLIGLQKYKNEIHGPWDPARPVIRRRWD